MHKIWITLIERIAKLLEVKSLVTLAMTFAMVALLFHHEDVSSEMFALFSGVYGSVITYFFTRKDSTTTNK